MIWRERRRSDKDQRVPNPVKRDERYSKYLSEMGRRQSGWILGQIV